MMDISWAKRSFWDKPLYAYSKNRNITTFHIIILHQKCCLVAASITGKVRPDPEDSNITNWNSSVAVFISWENERSPEITLEMSLYFSQGFTKIWTCLFDRTDFTDFVYEVFTF